MTTLTENGVAELERVISGPKVFREPIKEVPEVALQLTQQMTDAHNRIAEALERLADQLNAKAVALRAANDAVCTDLSGLLTRAQALHDVHVQAEAAYKAVG